MWFPLQVFVWLQSSYYSGLIKWGFLRHYKIQTWFFLFSSNEFFFCLKCHLHACMKSKQDVFPPRKGKNWKWQYKELLKGVECLLWSQNHPSGWKTAWAEALNSNPTDKSKLHLCRSKNLLIQILNSQVPSITDKRYEGGQFLPSLLDFSACFSH